jgi:coenzyme F420-reducing hydrogenase delta subunit
MKKLVKEVQAMKNLRLEIMHFKQAVANGDIEQKREREQKLREAFAELGLDADTITYLIASFKRAVEIEKAYNKKCEEIREVRELIAKAYRIVF